MNYHKKLQDLGFKKHQPLVVYEFRNYNTKTEGYDIKDSKQYFEDRTKEAFKSKYLPNQKSFIISTMNMVIDNNNFSKFQTYKWKISQDFNLFVTILGNRFSCFGTDDNAEKSNDGWMTQNNKVFFVCNDNLNNNFWKDILDFLPLQYKREILLKDII
jgi:hypothetical protein